MRRYEGTKVREQTARREEILIPSDLHERTKKLCKLKLGNCIRVTNNHNRLQGTISVITRLIPEQAYARPDNGKSEFRRHKKNSKRT